MQLQPVDLCYSKPDLYRLCDKETCILWEEKCPCKAVTEFQCSLSNCIPVELRCDGFKQCIYGDDEESCSINITEVPVKGSPTIVITDSLNNVQTVEENKLSLPVVVTIASLGVFVCVLIVILLYIIITRRQKNNTSRESQSATEPLRKSYISSDVEATSSSGYSTEKTYIYKKSEHDNYVPVSPECNESDNQIRNLDENCETDNIDESENNAKRKRKNLAINTGAEIYDTDPYSETRVSGFGKYTFKPRLKYMKSKPYHEIDKHDREKLYVINSYKHCSGKSILPSTLTFDKDPKTFSDKFATDLLCSSTPRQPVKHSLRPDLSMSKESLTAQSDIEIT